jgi:hypothetical protein
MAPAPTAPGVGGVDLDLGMMADNDHLGAKFRMAWFAYDGESAVWAVQPVFFYEWDDALEGRNKLGFSIGSFFRTQRWGAGIFYYRLEFRAFDDMTHEQIGVGLEHRFKSFEVRFNGYFPLDDGEKLEEMWVEETDDQQFFYSSYQKAVKSADLEFGGILTRQIRLYGILTWMDGVNEDDIVADAYEDDANRDLFGGGGRFDYEFKNGLRLRGRLTADQRDTRGTLTLAYVWPRPETEPSLAWTGHDIRKVWERDEEVKVRRYQRVVVNTAPSCDAGENQSVEIGATVQLSGTASDPDGDPLTYSWTFDERPAGSSAALSGADTLTPSFTADVEGTFIVRLTVTDGLASATDAVFIIAEEVEEEFEDVRIFPKNAEVDPYGTIQFTATGGDGNYTYSYVQNGSIDGSLDPNTGFYSAGCYGDNYDIIRVTDGRGDYDDATVYVRPGG